MKANELKQWLEEKDTTLDMDVLVYSAEYNTWFELEWNDIKLRKEVDYEVEKNE